jgi:hypothetical protein
MYWIPVLAEICFRAKPIMASPIVREPGFDLVSHRADQVRCSRYVLALLLLVPGVLANHV